MRNIHIINPEAGLKKKFSEQKNIEIYETKGRGDLEQFVKKTCLENPETHFTVYGGDGSVSEAVNGIMNAGQEARENAVLSIVPMGTGNDFVKNFHSDTKERKKVDIIKCNDRYCVNMINIGFDCDVVISTDKIKKFPLTSGSFGYIVGVVITLFKKIGMDIDIEMTDKNEKIIKKDGRILLTAIANGPFCGGGFKSNPAADISDGLFDVLIAEKVKRSTFAKLVGGYRNGTHVDCEKKEITKRYIGLASYNQCKSMKISKIKKICIDGEIFEYDSADISIIPSAVNVEMPAENIFKK